MSHKTGTFTSHYNPESKAHVVIDNVYNTPVCSARPEGRFKLISTKVDLNDITCKHCQAWFNKNLRYKIKPTQALKYQVIKHFITMIDIINAIDHPEGPTKGQAAAFCAQMGKKGYNEHSQILLNHHFFDYIKNKGVGGQCFIKWLIKHKYIKEAFEPISIMIRSEDQFWSVFERLNVNHEKDFEQVVKWEATNGKACRTIFNHLIKIKDNRKMKNPIP